MKKKPSCQKTPSPGFPGLSPTEKWKKWKGTGYIVGDTFTLSGYDGKDAILIPESPLYESAEPLYYPSPLLSTKAIE